MITYDTYKKSEQIDIMKNMIDKELSEPYSIYTYRYFIRFFPELTFTAYDGDEMIGCIIGKLDLDRKGRNRAMIVVKKQYRRQKIAYKLFELLKEQLTQMNCDEIVLETECCNLAALNFYSRFQRSKKLLNYYMNGNDAFRLVYWITEPSQN